MPKDWQPDADDCAYAIDHGLEPKTIATDFRDYWHARAGPGAIKMNWKLTWQRWCRTEKKGNGHGSLRVHTGPVEFPITAAANRIRQKLGLVEN